MSLTTVISCGVALAIISLIFYALWTGHDVKAAMKVAFIGFTFEAKDKRPKKVTEKNQDDN
jgi:hypothetical protein